MLLSKYTCECCNETHEWNDDFTEEEMRKEYTGNFPDDPDMKEELVIICDDCYKKMRLK